MHNASAVIRRLSISRFKSIKSLSIPCRKVNVFIGGPDTGKTNLLEALYVLSNLGWPRRLAFSLRLRQDVGFDALFYRQFFDEAIEVSAELDAPLTGLNNAAAATVRLSVDGQSRSVRLDVPCPGGGTQFPGRGTQFHLGFDQGAHVAAFDFVRYYLYGSSEQWRYETGGHRGAELVTPPHGENLVYIARHNARVYEFFRDMLADLNWKVQFDQAQKTFRLAEVREAEILNYNLDLLSDSLKRLLFYGAILLTSSEAVIVLDEPDVFAFPPYPKTLGEMIAADDSNQFFLTTHNPYFLAGLIEKTKTDDLALFVCDRDPDGATGAKLLERDEVARVIEFGASVFFNLDQFLPRG